MSGHEKEVRQTVSEAMFVADVLNVRKPETDSPLVLAVTGHRPDKLGGYSTSLDERLKQFSIEEIRSVSPSHVITGMALGFDTAIAEACVVLNVPFTAAIPFRGQESMWPVASRTRYRYLLSKAALIVEVCDPPYAAWKMMRRNVWMVDRCHSLMALWNESDGGTGNCARYAKAMQKPIVNTWQRWLRYP